MRINRSRQRVGRKRSGFLPWSAPHELKEPWVRITAVETLVVNAELRNWILVKVRTDQDGLHGWGEASLNWKTRAVVGAIEDLAEFVVGRDPRDIEQLVRIMTKHSYYRLGIVGTTAISGIEHALWDIFGKSLGCTRARARREPALSIGY